ncbi:methyltransferase [Luteimonas sp. FCS-9]|nr:methyltransferase [Luteimonas sp. FCS-9]
MGENGAHGITRIFNAPCSGAPMKQASGRVRIVGGRWRGTRLDVPDAPGLRPTGDRVRETLFNWLQPALPGARVVDAFAGTGALGLEAVSRGARSALLIEREPALAAALSAVAARLPGGQAVEVRRGDALQVLAALPAGGFDIAFVDPPFAADLWTPALAALDIALAPQAWLYVESPVARPAQPPAGWRQHRELATREAHCALWRRDG